MDSFFNSIFTSLLESFHVICHFSFFSVSEDELASSQRLTPLLNRKWCKQVHISFPNKVVLICTIWEWYFAWTGSIFAKFPALDPTPTFSKAFKIGQTQPWCPLSFCLPPCQHLTWTLIMILLVVKVTGGETAVLNCLVMGKCGISVNESIWPRSTSGPEVLHLMWAKASPFIRKSERYCM